MNLLFSFLLFLGWVSISLAQPFIPPLYSLEGGSRVYFVPSHTISYKGQEFSEEYTLEFDLFASVLTPAANFTLSHFPTKYLTNEFSSLSVSRHRVDTELKHWPIPFNPIITIEMINLDFYRGGWDNDSQLFRTNTDSRFDVYGGIGGAITTKLTDQIDIKGVAISRFLNQSGWEFGFSSLWKTPKVFTVDSHLVGGINFRDFQFEWGKLKGYGVMLEFGLTF